MAATRVEVVKPVRYYVTISGRTFEVDVESGAARVDGRSLEADLERLGETAVRHLRIDGRSYTVIAKAGAARESWDVRIDGHRFEAEVVDERTRAIRQMTGAAAGRRGPRPVRAPMPGLVVRIEVEPGQTVRVGEGIVIIEAMKMENELKAEAEGVVSRILVDSGQAVEKGTVLVEFEG